MINPDIHDAVKALGVLHQWQEDSFRKDVAEQLRTPANANRDWKAIHDLLELLKMAAAKGIEIKVMVEFVKGHAGKEHHNQLNLIP